MEKEELQYTKILEADLDDDDKKGSLIPKSACFDLDNILDMFDGNHQGKM